MGGQVLNDRYRLESRLGRGAMGEVWGAYDMVMRRSVAVKLVHLGRSASEWRFWEEIKAAAALKHVHVVAVYDCGEYRADRDQLLYLVMERVEGGDLAEVFAGPGPLPWYDVVHWARQIADGLAAAHENGIVHRDVKPANVLRASDGVVKLADFGIAKVAGDLARAGMTLPGTAIGTPAYMSPEQASGDRDVDCRSDLYSLGCLLYEGLSGAPPFTADDPGLLMRKHLEEEPLPLSGRVPGLPAEISDLVGSLLAKHPDGRPGSAAEVSHRLATALDGYWGSTAAAELLEKARQEAAGMRAAADGYARASREEADRYADAVRAGADRLRREAEQVFAEAAERSRRLLAGARGRARGRVRFPERVGPASAGGPAGTAPPRDPLRRRTGSGASASGAAEGGGLAAPDSPAPPGGAPASPACAPVSAAGVPGSAASSAWASRLPLMLPAAPARLMLTTGPVRPALPPSPREGIEPPSELLSLLRRAWHLHGRGKTP
ncbi:serine/threonine-protein kinase [Streptomyces vinaceus]|uniref:serine/threonine-protein kinase n=1 Tax=Streptomyces vinaceus TaxID=1960 RepID=UPI00381A31FA